SRDWSSDVCSSDLVAADNAADYSGKVFGEISVEAPKASKATDEARQATESWLGIQREVPEGVDSATNSVESQTLVLGENAEAWLKNSLAQEEAIQKFATDTRLQSAMQAVG